MKEVIIERVGMFRNTMPQNITGQSASMRVAVWVTGTLTPPPSHEGIASFGGELETTESSEEGPESVRSEVQAEFDLIGAIIIR